MLALEFVQILFHHEGLDELAALRGEGDLMEIGELLDDEAGHHLLAVGGIGEELGIGGDAGIRFLLERGESFAEFPLADGGVAFFHEAFVEAGVFRVVGVFGAEELVLPLQHAGAASFFFASKSVL